MEAKTPAAPPAQTPSADQVSVIVIGFNDAEHIADAVLSALRQGPAVAEVVAVDDASTDRTAEVLEDLAERYARVRVMRRATNSGGCGSPRNDGLRLATAPYVMFLDSDDVLPPGAVNALLGAARRHGAPVTAGACVRRELPSGRDVPWQPELFGEETVHEGPAALAGVVRDTLCVNKLYARSFLLDHAIAFPDGAFTYEDFVFTARVLAAAPRLAVIPDTVYVWHVRRSAAKQSISLDRGGITNWTARIEAHRRAVAILEEAGREEIAHAARTKFLDHDLRMYARELRGRGEEYRADWWRLTRGYLLDPGFGASELAAAEAPARWTARVVAAAEAPRDLRRLVELANRPARLLPPYAEAGGDPVWSDDLPGVVLDRLDEAPLSALPVAVEAEPEVGSRSARLRIRVHELYGRLAAAGPRSVDIELRHRVDGRLGLVRDAVLTPEGGGERGRERDGADGEHGGADRGSGGEVGSGTSAWTAEVCLDLNTVAAAGTRGADPDVWDVRVLVRCADGATLDTAARATGPGLRRTAVLSPRHGLLLVQPHATTGGSLAVRVAPGPRSAMRVAARRLRRLTVSR
ncbi:glycosyltransferase family 2 protein [Streptomyces sp. URMC 123]|uniref:glycosyltransferase family 2 protein n=1 Tax=Streptomyces sp. URMC 123 TaxID=3423403 RepID=UPI003F1CC1A3